MRKRDLLEEKLNPSQSIDDNVDPEELFRKAMAGVTPYSSRPSRVRRRNGFFPRRAKIWSPVENDRSLLDEFIRGEDEFDWAHHPEYQEGGPQRWNRKLVRKLRRGCFAVQAQLDLHGLHQQEARRQLEEFIRRCSDLKIQCVRIIHGKGNNSPNRHSILKARVSQWLSQKRMARYVVLYTSALPQDGGVGALYVLLKKSSPQRRPGKKD